MINCPYFLINLFSSINPMTAGLDVMSGTGLYLASYPGPLRRRRKGLGMRLGVQGNASTIRYIIIYHFGPYPLEYCNCNITYEFTLSHLSYVPVDTTQLLGVHQIS